MGLLLIDQGITIVVEAAVAFDTYYIRTLFSTLIIVIWLAQLVGASPSKSFGFAFATAPMWLLFLTVLNESREILCELILRWNAFDYEFITCKDFIYQTNHKTALSWILRKLGTQFLRSKGDNSIYAASKHSFSAVITTMLLCGLFDR